MCVTNTGNPFADDSDDEDDGKMPKDKVKDYDDFAPYGPGSLHFKPSRSENTHLYYVNYNKIKELSPEERQELHSKKYEKEAEKLALELKIKSMIAAASELLSQPTNEELSPLLKNGEDEKASLEEKAETNRLFKVNESTRLNIRKKIRTMAATWRKRKRTCMEFLMQLEESSEGLVSVAKLRKDNGPFCIAFDGLHADAELRSKAQMAQKRQQGMISKRRNGIVSKTSAQNDADPSGRCLVAVILGKNDIVERKYFDPENKENYL